MKIAIFSKTKKDVLKRISLFCSLQISLTSSIIGTPGRLSGECPPSAQGVILESQDGVPHRAPCMEPDSPSACVSASLCVCVCLS